MDIRKPEKEDYGNVWQKVYRIIAIILLVSTFLHFIGELMLLQGVLWNEFLLFPPLPFG